MFSNQTSRVYCDLDDLHGAAKLATEAAWAASDVEESAFYAGAAMTLQILSDTSRIQYPKDFMAVLDARGLGKYTMDNKEE